MTWSTVATKGFDKAIRRLNDVGARCLNPREALEAAGKEAHRRHVGYFKSNGPPGAKWPELEQSTKKRKAKRGRLRKLVDEGEMEGGFVYRTVGKAVRLLNEKRQAFFLQETGVGKKKKKFVVVATNLKKQDPELLDRIKLIFRKFIMRGKTR